MKLEEYMQKRAGKIMGKVKKILTHPATKVVGGLAGIGALTGSAILGYNKFFRDPAISNILSNTENKFSSPIKYLSFPSVPPSFPIEIPKLPSKKVITSTSDALEYEKGVQKIQEKQDKEDRQKERNKFIESLDIPSLDDSKGKEILYNLEYEKGVQKIQEKQDKEDRQKERNKFIESLDIPSLDDSKGKEILYNLELEKTQKQDRINKLKSDTSKEVNKYLKSKKLPLTQKTSQPGYSYVNPLIGAALGLGTGYLMDRENWVLPAIGALGGGLVGDYYNDQSMLKKMIESTTSTT